MPGREQEVVKVGGGEATGGAVRTQPQGVIGNGGEWWCQTVGVPACLAPITQEHQVVIVGMVTDFTGE